jgi:succinate dehydrogenase / fumarate reductase iron-sulfur subunit
VNLEGVAVASVVWDDACGGEHCGACSMLINGRAGLACKTQIEDLAEPVCLEPLSAFAVIRDLVVDRRPVSDNLYRVAAHTRFDGFVPVNTDPALPARAMDSLTLDLMTCTQCAVCLDACPNYGDTSKFLGPMVVAQVYRYNQLPNGAPDGANRLQRLMQGGGIEDCGNVQNCVKVCPEGIPLTQAIGRLKWQVTGEWVKRVFE